MPTNDTPLLLDKSCTKILFISDILYLINSNPLLHMRNIAHEHNLDLHNRNLAAFNR